MKSSYLLAGVALGAAVAMPVTAWAIHARPGLWEVKVQTQAGPMQGMPDMSQMPPAAQAQLRAQGIQMTGGGIITRHCLTAAEANSATPNLESNPDCKVENVKMTGNSYSADVVCKGQTNARGHVQFVFDSPEHYSGTETFSVVAGGQHINNVIRIDAHWIAADCGKIH
jgi:hypothetical protein